MLLTQLGVLLTLLGLAAIPAAGLVSRRRPGPVDPQKMLRPDELAAMTGNRYAPCCVALMELVQDGLVDEQGRPTGRRRTRPLPPLAAHLFERVESGRRWSATALEPPEVRGERMLIWRGLVDQGMATSTEAAGGWRTAVAVVPLVVLTVGSVLWVSAEIHALPVVIPGVVAAGWLVYRLVQPRARLTLAGEERLERAQEAAGRCDPRRDGRVPADPVAARSVVAVLGVGALYATDPALVAVLGHIPAAELTAAHATPHATHSAGPQDEASGGGDGDAGCGCGGCGGCG